MGPKRFFTQESRDLRLGHGSECNRKCLRDERYASLGLLCLLESDMAVARLGREELKWIQSLDLSYSIKNPKRDFANGFLVAEILSRYYVDDVTMHSYDNGFSLQRKLDNWSLLQKFFAKKNIQVSAHLITDIVHCKSSDAPVSLISTLYELLTGRQSKKAPPPTTLPQPAYARPNATEVVRQQLRDAELSTKYGDIKSQQQHVAALLDDHASMERVERESFAAAHPIEALRPRGLAGGANTKSKTSRLPPKTVSEDMQGSFVQFKEVQVKVRDFAPHPPSRNDDQNSTYVSSGAEATTPVRAMASNRGVLQILAEQVLSVPELSDGIQPEAAELFDRIIKPPTGLEAEIVATPLEMTAEVNVLELSNLCLTSLHEAWQLFNLLFSILSSTRQHTVFNAACDLLASVGRAMIMSESLATEKLFVDFGLPKLVPLLRTHGASAPKTQALASLLYAFTVDNDVAHIAAIKSLQDALSDQEVFVLSLCALVPHEPDMSEDLLDLYVYYCIIGLGMPSPRMRAASLSMLPIIATHDHKLVLDMLPRLAPMSNDSWWEVRAQLASVASALLALGDAAESHAILQGILVQALTSKSPPVRSVALAACTPLLSHQPPILPAFIDSLLGTSTSRRYALLSGAGPIVDGEARTSFILPRMTEAWPALTVARGIVAGAKALNLPNLEHGRMEVLAAAMGGATEDQAELWSEWLMDAKEYIYVSLCDEELSATICTSLAGFLGVVGEGGLSSFSTLLSSLRLVFPEGAAVCQSCAVGLLEALFRRGEPLSGAVATVVKSFDSSVRSACFPALSQQVDELYE